MLNEHVTKTLGLGAIVVQGLPLGTGHAVRAAAPALADFDGDVIGLYGDGPLIQAKRIEELFAVRAAKGGQAILAFKTRNPFGYGRIVSGGDGAVERIVEEKDASQVERTITLCNSGLMSADVKSLFTLVSMLKNDNAKREYYLTDVVALGRSSGVATSVVIGDEAETLGVNSRAELAQAETVFQNRARAAAMEVGSR